MKTLFDLKVFDNMQQTTNKGLEAVSTCFELLSDVIGVIVISSMQLLLFVFMSPFIFVGWLASLRESLSDEDS
jgi:hypothetical protein